MYGLPGLEGDVVHGEEVGGPGARAHLDTVQYSTVRTVQYSTVQVLELTLKFSQYISRCAWSYLWWKYYHIFIHLYHLTLVHKPQPEEILVSEVVKLVGVFITNLVQVFPP